MDLRPWNDGPDAELEQLAGGDLELLELGRRLRTARPEPRIDPEFQRRLRAQLMTAAETELRPRGLRRLLRPRAHLLAYGATGMGAAMIAAAALAYYAPHSDRVTIDYQASIISGDPSVDPNDVIRISFNRVMDRQAVVRGLVIEPATTYKSSWKDNGGRETLTITPDHHLQPNTPYVVTIPKSAARDTKGDIATKDITITFGTSPVAPASPSAPAGPVTLSPKDAGDVVAGSLLGFAGDGSLLATSGLLPAPTTASPGDATPAPVPALVRYPSDGPVRLGDPATSVALSPAGYSLATLTPGGDGHAVVAVSAADGSHRSVLSTVADLTSPLGWGGDPTQPTVVFTSGGQLTSFDMEHHAHAVAGPQVASGQALLLAPGGRYAFLVGAPAPSSPPPPPSSPNPPPGAGPLIPPIHIGSPGGAIAPAASPVSSTDATTFSSPDPGHLLDLQATPTSAAPPSLTGLAAGDLPTFSGDGRRVAWIDTHSGAQPVIDVQLLDGTGTAAHIVLPAAAASDKIGGLALDFGGDRVAYTVTHADGTADLRVARVTDGRPLASGSGPGLSNPVFSPDGASLGYLRKSGSDTVAEVASVPGAPTGLSVPRAAQSAIDQLVDAEIKGDQQALGGLVAPQSLVDDLVSHLPTGLSRGYVISAVPNAAGDTVTAQIRLLRDPTGDHLTAAFTDQTATLQREGGKYIVTQSVIAQPLHDESPGPQVVQVDTRRVLGVTSVRITFDSDLDPSSVTTQLITLNPSTGLAAPRVTYDATTRTVTVTFLGRLRHSVDLTVGEGLRDVNGQGLAQAFTTTVGSGQ